MTLGQVTLELPLVWGFRDHFKSLYIERFKR